MNLPQYARAVSLAVTTCLAATVQAAPIPTLFSTGLDAAGAPLALGAADPHYIVVETGLAARVLNPPNGLYFPNNANSQWIWENANGQPTNVTRTFRTTFDLTGFDHTTASIDGLWGTDNEGLDIVLNGVNLGIQLLGNNIPNFSLLHAFTISSGFVAGLNTLDFVVRDNGGVSGFRAQFTTASAEVSDDTTDVPEPASLGVLGLGLAALVLRRRRQAA